MGPVTDEQARLMVRALHRRFVEMSFSQQAFVVRLQNRIARHHERTWFFRDEIRDLRRLGEAMGERWPKLEDEP